MRNFWKNQPLAFKLMAAMSLLIILVTMSVTTLFILRYQQIFQTELEQQASLLLSAIETMSSDALYRLDADTLGDLMEGLSRVQSTATGRVYDTDGRIIADVSRAGSLLYSSEPDPLGQSLLDSGTIQFFWESDRLIAGKAVLLGRQQLGAISVELSMRPLIEKLDGLRVQGIIVAGIGVSVGILLAILISRTITRPLQQLNTLANEVAEGDIIHTVEISGRDEVATLGQTFNRMSIKLQQTIQVLEHRAIDLEVANAQVRESSRLKSEFLATMSHELRTPLNAIIGFSGILLEGMAGQLDVVARDMVDGIYVSSRQLLAMIDDILDLSRIEAGQLRLISTPIVMSTLVKQWMTQMNVLASQKGLRFQVNVDPHLPPVIFGDKDRLTQIVVNLLSNAFKFTEKGTVQLNLKARSTTWIIEVEDEGIGIPPHALQYIFEEFRQVDGSSRRSKGGTGLGLAIVRRLCRLMNGEVAVQSTLGQGSKFTVTLPLSSSEGQQHERRL
jgi:signal transduction histidine kinase